MQSVADALVCTLREYGVRYVFGVSGANIEHIHDALFRHGREKLQSVLCKSEVGAAFMADGYARQSGGLGVCCATSGGGAMNLAVGIAEARASGVPVLALVGCPPDTLTGRGAFQEAEGGRHQVDGEMMWRAVAKSVVVLRAENFWCSLRSILVDMLSGHPGPGALLIARDTMDQPVPPCPAGDERGFILQIAEEVQSVQVGSELPPAEFRQAWHGAKRPVIIVGAGMAHCPWLVEWAEREAVPVATTLEAPSVFPQTHPQFLGMVGVAGHASCHDYIESSDCILVLGSSLDSMSRAPIENTLADKPVWVVHTNLQTVPDWPGLEPIEACPKRWLAGGSQTAGRPDRASTRQWTEPRSFERQIVRGSGRPGVAELGNTEAADMLQPHLDRFDVVMFDAGNCTATAAHQMRFPAGTRSQFALGMGGMGYAVCAGIGAQLARPDLRTMVMCGDGAMLMVGTELHTAIELGLPILWVVFNDSQHGMCTTRQRSFFDGRIHATRYSSVNFCTMAEALAGDNPVWLARADTPEAVAKSLQDYAQLKTPMPGVLELVISVEEVPPFFPLMSARSPVRSAEGVPA